MQHCLEVGQGQSVETPAQTMERVEKALSTLQSIERFACDQYDYVSFAIAWMLTSKGGAHALDYDFKLVSPGVMAPLQQRVERGLRQSMSVLLGSEVSELVWERVKTPHLFWQPGHECWSDGFCGASYELGGY